MIKNEVKVSLSDPSYSMRRYYVDTFLTKQFEALRPDSTVLNLGGHKLSNRGAFNPYSFGLDILCVNITEEKGADIVADAALIPLRANRFDAVLCSEVLEHTLNPVEVLAEIHRVLKPEGKAFLSVPLHYHIHGDPFDYGRYTKSFLENSLMSIGFTEKKIQIHPQGKYWSVLVDFIRMGLVEGINKGPNIKSRLCALGLKMLAYAKKKALIWDTESKLKISSQFTTGYGIVVEK